MQITGDLDRFFIAIAVDWVSPNELPRGIEVAEPIAGHSTCDTVLEKAR